MAWSEIRVKELGWGNVRVIGRAYHSFTFTTHSGILNTVVVLPNEILEYDNEIY